MVKHRQDSIIELANKKTPEELTVENEKLRELLAQQAAQITDLQVALCEMYEGGGV